MGEVGSACLTGHKRKSVDAMRNSSLGEGWLLLPVVQRPPLHILAPSSPPFPIASLPAPSHMHHRTFHLR